MVEGGSFRVELTRGQIGDVVGLTPVHTNRILQKLRARGMLAIDNQNVHIDDLDGLRSLAPTRPTREGCNRLF